MLCVILWELIILKYFYIFERHNWRQPKTSLKTFLCQSKAVTVFVMIRKEKRTKKWRRGKESNAKGWKKPAGRGEGTADKRGQRTTITTAGRRSPRIDVLEWVNHRSIQYHVSECSMSKSLEFKCVPTVPDCQLSSWFLLICRPPNHLYKWVS